MTKAVYPDKTFILIKYDNQKDWVTGFTDREKCSETYKYEASTSNPELNYWATTVKTCDGVVVANNRYEFWHKQLPAGQTVLSRILTNLNGSVRDVVYDDILGKPLSIKTDIESASYTYLPNGLLKTKTTKEKTLEFSYDNKLQKVSKVVEKTSDKKSRTSNFKYDSKGNLIFAENSEGKKIKLEYDSKGRIVRILDGGKTPVTLKYEEKFGKPSEISRKDLGSVVISYSATGEISSVESSKGPLAAEQIAGSYNTLLGILAPATQNIY
jgi:YD repeat-containing protein